MCVVQSCSYFTSFTFPLKLALKNSDTAAGNIYTMFKVITLLHFIIVIIITVFKVPFITFHYQYHRVHGYQTLLSISLSSLSSLL